MAQGSEVSGETIMHSHEGGGEKRNDSTREARKDSYPCLVISNCPNSIIGAMESPVVRVLCECGLVLSSYLTQRYLGRGLPEGLACMRIRATLQ